MNKPYRFFYFQDNFENKLNFSREKVNFTLIYELSENFRKIEFFKKFYENSGKNGLKIRGGRLLEHGRLFFELPPAWALIRTWALIGAWAPIRGNTVFHISKFQNL